MDMLMSGISLSDTNDDSRLATHLRLTLHGNPAACRVKDNIVLKAAHALREANQAVQTALRN